MSAALLIPVLAFLVCYLPCDEYYEAVGSWISGIGPIFEINVTLIVAGVGTLLAAGFITLEYWLQRREKSQEAAGDPSGESEN